MLALAKGDKLFDRNGRMWKIKRIGSDPGTKQTYYCITDGDRHGFVWKKTIEILVKADMLRGIDQGPPNSIIRYR
jgi:hypothetical protein